MKISKKEILEYARDLRDQEHVDTHHLQCPESGGNRDHKPRLWVKKDGQYVAYHCKHCGGRGRYYQGYVRKYSVEEGLTAPRSTADEGDKVHNLPRDTNRNLQDWPREARIWVLRYITPEQVERYGISYSATLHRVVLPVFGETGLLGYQTRRVLTQDQGPKYLTYRNVANLWFRGGDTNSSVAVVVEDILSAIKCSEVCCAYAMIGVYESDTLVLELIKYSRVILMLDNDNAKVRKRQQELKHRLQQFTDVEIKYLIKDPKEHTVTELRKIIWSENSE